MKIIKLACALSLTSVLAACGTPIDEPKTSSSSSSSTGGSTSSSSSSSTSSSSGGPSVGYVTLSNGKGGVNYEPVELSALNPEFDIDESKVVFEKTLYKHLRSNSCVGCHNSAAGPGNAPLHSDDDLDLAHRYALTRVNFKDPVNSKFVVRMTLDRHNCPGSNCKSAGEAMLKVVEEWKAGIEHMLPDTPHAMAGETISESKIEGWIATDKAKLASADRKYVVYTSLHELHNEGLTADELNIVRAGLSKALNTVARWAPDIVNPTDVTGDGILYKFDTRSYWGYNQGVKKIFFGGSDDDLAFGDNKMNWRGEGVSGFGTGVDQQKYNFTNKTVKDDDAALMIWERVLHGNVEGAVTDGTIPPYIDGFKGNISKNDAGEYIKVADLEWVEAAQLIYTLTRPDVYNGIMMNPFYAEEMERNLEVDISDGMDSYDYMVTMVAITVDSRLFWRAKRKGGGFYWKTWDIFTGQLASGRDRSIFDVYADADGKDIRFPWWANPIPKFVEPGTVRDGDPDFSFVASLAQTGGFAGFSSGNSAGCDDQPGAVSGFGFCRHFSGQGGAQQSASEIIYDLPNGLNGYYLTGGFNQRRVDAFTNIVRDPRILTGAGDNIASATGYSYTNGGGGGQFQRAGDPRLNTGSSCIGCHADGMNRSSADLRDWLDNNPARLPKGQYGVDSWINDAATVKRVKELYPTKAEMNALIESDRKVFLDAMGKVKKGMLLGTDINVYVEPIIWAVEYVQRTKYKYPQTRSN